MKKRTSKEKKKWVQKKRNFGY